MHSAPVWRWLRSDTDTGDGRAESRKAGRDADPAGAGQPWVERQMRASGALSFRPLNREPKSQTAHGSTAPAPDVLRSG
ncbi:hypothetical protein B4N89_36945 [Embleya scabrispora]|uniref:Uncharacterized protein n=1 Tax=Embleya scabrispora TaxID=159449 RepID=A0A1T3NM41_9ACTN|nr:hypothetical protein B4N89_36945 [Embleya scabrispora]